jgi:IS30 family transposase
MNSNLTMYWTYSADIAQTERDRRSTNKGPALKIGKDHKLAEYLEKTIGNEKEKMSP